MTTSPEKSNPQNDDVERQPTNASAESPEAPFSIFTTGQKQLIVFLAATAGVFSPITGSIYFPALNILAQDYHVSNSLINLTVTTYLVRCDSAA